jgi:hypothetical protein
MKYGYCLLFKLHPVNPRHIARFGICICSKYFYRQNMVAFIDLGAKIYLLRNYFVSMKTIK